MYQAVVIQFLLNLAPSTWICRLHKFMANFGRMVTLPSGPLCFTSRCFKDTALWTMCSSNAGVSCWQNRSLSVERRRILEKDSLIASFESCACWKMFVALRSSTSSPGPMIWSKSSQDLQLMSVKDRSSTDKLVSEARDWTPWSVRFLHQPSRKHFKFGQ